jgi:hypothetical protein
VTSENPRRHSKNLTVLIVILFFYIACAYSRVINELLSIHLNQWELAFCFWLIVGAAMRYWRFLMTELFSLAAFGVVFTILQKVTFAISYADIHETTSARSLPVVVLVFLVSPGIFFSFNFDPYGLVKELPRIVNVRATAQLLLMLSAGEMFQSRFAEVSENLFVRGINVRSGVRRLMSVPTFLPPLLMALIQEAAYRHSYNEMLGCPADRFPVQSARTTVSLPQIASLIVALVLVVFRLLI